MTPENQELFGNKGSDATASMRPGHYDPGKPDQNRKP